jgi:acyl dehydratase/ribosomal protein S18 acetylase RimI-like enzyme
MEYSEVETRRFGFRIFRGKILEIDDKAITAAILEQEPDIAILRVPSSKQFQIARLDRTGFPWLIADTLVCYRLDLTKCAPPALRNQDMTFILCEAEHSPDLARLAREIFDGYANHYRSNPLLDRKAILEAFEDWSQHFIGEPGRICWLVRSGIEYIAFVACSFDGKTCELGFGGVRPSASGRGVYTDLIRFVRNHFRNQGCRTMLGSTQTQNFAVQTVWNREGFTIFESYATIHINALLRRSLVEPRTLDFSFSGDDIARCGDFSGDLNPLHFDSAFARQIGFEGRIAHGLLVGSMISKYYGTEFPGPGTIFLNYQYKFLRPVYPDRKYRLTFTFPHVNEERGIYKSLARVTDSENRICLLAYNDLYRPRPRA